MKKKFQLIRQVIAGLMIITLCGPLFINVAAAPQKSAALSKDQKILHLLNRISFGPREADIEKVREMGIDKYIELQLDPDSIPDAQVATVLRDLEILDMSTAEIFAKYPNPGALIRRLEGNRRAEAANETASMDDRRAAQRMRREKLASIYRQYGFKPANRIMFEVQSARIMRATYTERQLEEVMVDFWANHFNVYSRKAATRWYIPSYERDVLRKHALGNFRDLVEGTARHPAMLFYLDNFQSVSPDASQNRGVQRLKRFIRNGELDSRVRARLRSRGLTDEQIDRRIQAIQRGGNNERGINENYARELMELHTLGVDGGYTAEDIKEVARAFTGWTIFDPLGYRKAAANIVRDREDRQMERQARRFGVSPNTESGTFMFVDRLHDKSPKTVLGQRVSEGGINDGLQVIDILVQHPSTAKFIARKLAVKFVSDEPSDTLVNKVAKAFTRSNGDIKSTLSALFKSDEFFSQKNYRAKIKTPFELMVSSLRALDADIKGTRALVGLLNRMGEPLYGYQAPTGYPDTAADWVNTGALLERMNFAVALSSNRLPQTTVNLGKFDSGGKSAMLNRAIDLILHGEVSESTRATLIRQFEQPLPDIRLDPEQVDTYDETFGMPGAGNRAWNRQPRLLAPRGNPDVFKVVGLTIGSPEFQRQ